MVKKYYKEAKLHWVSVYRPIFSYLKTYLFISNMTNFYGRKRKLDGVGPVDNRPSTG